MPEYSNSQLSKFDQCALQYKFLGGGWTKTKFSRQYVRIYNILLTSNPTSSYNGPRRRNTWPTWDHASGNTARAAA